MKAGISGKNIGTSTGLKRLDKATYGIQKRFLYLIGGDTGSGKTTLAMYYLYSVLNDYFESYKREKENKAEYLPGLKIVYFTLEMSAEVLIAKLLSLHIYEVHKVIISFDELFSFNKILDKNKRDLINNCKDWLDAVGEVIVFISGQKGASNVESVFRKLFEEHGSFTLNAKNQEVYTLYDSNKEFKFLSFVDHVGLLPGTKEQKDAVANTLIDYRNICNMTIFAVQQLNRNFKSDFRRDNNFKYIDLSDFKGTSSFSDAADVILAIYHANREQDMSCKGYDINTLKDRFRLIQILKHRYGVSDTCDACAFYGEVGKWMELPKPMDLQTMGYSAYMELPTQSGNIY